RGRAAFASDALLGGFFDVTCAYRFGPPQHDLAVATLFDGRHRVVSEAFYFVQPREPPLLPAARLDAEAEPTREGRFRVVLHCDHFLQSVFFDAKGFFPDDNYFHLVPGRRKVVHFTAVADRKARFRGYVEALNLRDPVGIHLREMSS